MPFSTRELFDYQEFYCVLNQIMGVPLGYKIIMLISNLKQLISFQKFLQYRLMQQNSSSLAHNTPLPKPLPTARNPNPLIPLGWIHSIILILIIPSATCLGLNSTYIVNGNFSTPTVSSRQSFVYYSAQGWNCTWICQFKNCKNQLNYWKSQGKIYADCGDQAIDLNSVSFNQRASQQLELAKGLYQVCFNYYYPVMSAALKELKVYFNKVVILDVKPTINASALIYYGQVIVEAIDGFNVLEFENLGYDVDGLGFRINNVSLYNYTVQSGVQNTSQNSTTLNTTQDTTPNTTLNNTQSNTQNNTQNTTLNNTANAASNKTAKLQKNALLSQFITFFFHTSSITNNIPGGRVIFRSVMSFLINFDRLQLYIYHNRSYSPNTQFLILAINNFLSTKTNLANQALKSFSKQMVEDQDRLINSSSYKEGYIFYESFEDQFRNPDYFENFNDSFVYFFPFIIVFVVILNILFRIFFNRPISLLFRKYSLWAIMLIMIFDGNIENITFFSLAEFKIFFSDSFQHRLGNAFILIFYYLVIFIVFGLLLWAKYHYGKKIKYLLDEAHPKMDIVWGILIDRGVICLLFGTVHQLFISSKNMQLGLLGVIEIGWIVKKVISIYRGLYQEKLLVCASILNGFCRVLLQISIYLYQFGQIQTFINDYIHTALIYAIICAALLEIIIGLFYCFKNIVIIWRIDTNRVRNIKKEAKTLSVKKIPRTRPMLKVSKKVQLSIQNQMSFVYSLNGRQINLNQNVVKLSKPGKRKKVNIIA